MPPLSLVCTSVMRPKIYVNRICKLTNSPILQLFIKELINPIGNSVKKQKSTYVHAINA